MPPDEPDLVEAHYWRVFVWLLLERREHARTGRFAAFSFALLAAVLLILNGCLGLHLPPCGVYPGTHTPAPCDGGAP